MASDYEFWEHPNTLKTAARFYDWVDVSRPDVFYSAVMKETLKHERLQTPFFKSHANTAISDWGHTLAGRPYCKVHAGMAAMLAKTNINIPCKDLLLPLPTLELRLPRKDNPFQERSSAPPLRSVLIVSDLSHVRGATEIHPWYTCERLRLDNRLMLYLDFGEMAPSEISGRLERQTDWLDLVFNPSGSLEESFEMALAQPRPTCDDYVPSVAFFRSVLSLAVATCFFVADKHELVAPDIPRRYLERFRKAAAAGTHGTKEIETILEQSRKIGCNGWHLGRDVVLPRPVVSQHGVTSLPSHGSWESRYWDPVRSSPMASVRAAALSTEALVRPPDARAT